LGVVDKLKVVSHEVQELWSVLRDFLRDIVEGKTTRTHLREASAALSSKSGIEVYVLVTRFPSMFDAISWVVQ